jgi:hypothetical protein
MRIPNHAHDAELWPPVALATSFHGPDSPSMDPAGIVQTLKMCARGSEALCSIACISPGMYDCYYQKIVKHIELGLRQCAEAEQQRLCDSDLLIRAVKLLRNFSFTLKCVRHGAGMADSAMAVARYGQQFASAAAKIRTEIDRLPAEPAAPLRERTDIEEQMMFPMDME